MGGTCCGTTWRDELIPMIKGIDYFNPVVKDWTPECIEEEYRQKNLCNMQVYVITPRMKGVFSIAEIIESTYTKNTATFVCVLNEDVDQNGNKITFDEGQKRSLNAVVELADSNGAICCKDLKELAEKIKYYAGR